MSTSTNSSSFYRPPVETKRTLTYEELFGTPKPIDLINWEAEQKSEEIKRLYRPPTPEEIAKKEADKKEKEAYFAEQERIKSERLIAEGKEIVGTYRNSYDADDLFKLGAVDSIETAKAVADETYKQYWYDKANDIVGNWTDEDYKLIAEPQYEDVQVAVDSRRGVYKTKQRRVLPEGYEELQEINKFIEEGPLDFSSEETHLKLIGHWDYDEDRKKPHRHTRGKYQTWISPNNPLRQAVEAQADVMTKYLDGEGISIVTKYEDVEGFERPDPFRGEGFYLNTGTAAHIDWDSELKRMQRYESAPDAELGTYSQVFVRPDPDYGSFGDVLSVVGTLTGNPVMRNLGIAAQGGDVEDIIKGAVLQQVIPDNFLEDTLASVNITNDTINDLVGSDIGSTAWSEGLANVTTTGLEGGDLGDALLGEFGGELAEPIVGGALDALPDVDIPKGVTNVLETIETVAQPVINAVQTATETVGNVVDTAIIDPIDKLTEALIPDDVSLDDVVPSVEAVAEIEETPVEPEETPVEPEETPVEPEETPVEPEETVAETKEEIPVEPEDTTIVEKAASKVGLDAETVSNILDVPTDEVTKVFEDTTDALFAGESGKDALLEGLGGSALEELGEGAENLLGGAVDFVETILPLDPLEDVVGAGVELADAVIGVVGDSELVNAIEEGGKALGDLGQSAIDAVVDSDIVQAVGEAGQGVIDVGKDIGEAVVDTADDLLDTFGEEFVDPALKEGKKVAEAVVDKADDALDYLGEEYVDPALQQGKEIGQDLIDKGKEIGEGIVDTVDNVVDKFGEEAVDPALAKAKDLGQDLIDKGKDIGEAVVDTVDDALDYLGEEYVDPALQAVKNIELPEGPDLEFPEFTGPDIEFPEFTAPDIDLDIDIDMPEVDLPSFDPRLLAGLMAMPQQQQATQVEGLFDKELFKFDTEIKSTQEMLSPFMNLRRYG